MATTHPLVTRTAIAESMRGFANTGVPTPTLNIFDAGDVLLVSVTIPDFGVAAAAATTSASTGTTATAGAAGTASYGTIADGNGLERFRGDCGVGVNEVQINTLAIGAGDLVTVTNNISWTAPL